MTKDDVLMRCRQAVGVYPDRKYSVGDCLEVLRGWSPSTRDSAYEHLAHILASYVDSLPDRSKGKE